MKFIKKPAVIEAAQWFKNGDHPDDGGPGEGKVVRYLIYAIPTYSEGESCNQCNLLMHDHGWVDTLESGHIVCPGDWVITGVKGDHYPCKPDIFAKTYEPEVSPMPPDYFPLQEQDTGGPSLPVHPWDVWKVT